MQLKFDLPFEVGLIPKDSCLVGGAVRDAIIGRNREYLDLDLVTAEDAVNIGKKLANQYGAGFVLLDDQRRIARVVFPRATVDLAQQEGDLINDLYRRDYTINAIAYHLDSGRLIDPTSGVLDAQKGIIRMISRQNFIDDPLRLLRGYRQGAQLGFSIEENTRECLRELANLLTEVSAERVLAELRYLLNAQWQDYPQSNNYLMMAIADGILSGWLTDIHLSIDINTIYQSANYLAEIYPELGRLFYQPLRDTINNNLLNMAILSQLLPWDIEKSKKQLESLTFSTIEIRSITTLLTNYQDLIDLLKTKDLRAEYFWFQKVSNIFPILMIIAYANQISLTDLEPLINKYLNPRNQVAHPTPIITGNDLIKTLNLPPSPLIGKLLIEIQIARIYGLVNNQQEAIAFALNTMGNIS